MKKYILSIITLLLATFPITGFAVSVNLDLFDGNLSILDSLLLIAVGITIIGFLLICIAMFKPVKETDEYEDYDDVEYEEYDEDDEDDEAESEITITENPVEDAVLSQDDIKTAEKSMEENEPEEEAEEIIYSKLTLTGVNNNDFKVAPLKDITTFGRRKTNDVIFSDISISGEHGVITVEDDKVYITDKNSTNGTYINGKRIDEKTEIHKGDIITLGQLEYKIGL